MSLKLKRVMILIHSLHVTKENTILTNNQGNYHGRGNETPVPLPEDI